MSPTETPTVLQFSTLREMRAASGKKPEVRIEQRPQSIDRIGEGASSAQRRDAPAPQFVQRFLGRAAIIFPFFVV